MSIKDFGWSFIAWVNPRRGPKPSKRDVQVLEVGKWGKNQSTYCCWTKSCTSWYGKYPNNYKVLYIQGGARFLPSTVLVSILRLSLLILTFYEIPWTSNFPNYASCCFHRSNPIPPTKTRWNAAWNATRLWQDVGIRFAVRLLKAKKALIISLDQKPKRWKNTKHRPAQQNN